MAYVIETPEAGFQPITVVETSAAKHALGTIVRAVDPTYGDGMFIYLAGVGSTAVGTVVKYDQYAGTTNRTTTNSRGPLAVAMAAIGAGNWGWYQIAGAAVCKAGTVVAGTLVYISVTAGTLDDAVVATDKVDGALFKTADGTPSAGLAVVQLNYPACNGNG